MQKGVFMIESKKGLNLINVIRKLDHKGIEIEILLLIYDEIFNKKTEYYTVWNNEQLVNELGYDRRSIYRALKQLEKNKAIEIRKIKGKNTKLIKIIE